MRWNSEVERSNRPRSSLRLIKKHQKAAKYHRVEHSTENWHQTDTRQTKPQPDYKHN